jgi:hypothetical protein
MQKFICSNKLEAHSPLTPRDRRSICKRFWQHQNPPEKSIEKRPSTKLRLENLKVKKTQILKTSDKFENLEIVKV